MKLTVHAEVRTQQRGIPPDSVDLILTYGAAVRRSGGDIEYRLTKRRKARLITQLKRQIGKVESATDKGVLLGADGSIITVYHLRD